MRALSDGWVLFSTFLKDPQAFVSVLSLYIYEIL